MITDLLLRHVGSVARHRSSENQVSRTLLAENLTGHTSAVIGTREIDIDNAMPVLELVVQTTRFRRYARVRDHDIQSTEVLNYRICCAFHLIIVLY